MTTKKRTAQPGTREYEVSMRIVLEGSVWVEATDEADADNKALSEIDLNTCSVVNWKARVRGIRR